MFANEPGLESLTVGGVAQLNFECFVIMDPWDAYPKHLLEPRWDDLQPGCTTSVVVDVTVVGADISLGILPISGRQVRVIGELGPHLINPNSGRITLFNACVDFWNPFVDLLVTVDTVVLAHSPVTSDQVFKVVELCSGLAASSVGLTAAGFTHVASVEWSEPLASVHRSVHKHVPVVVGDIGEIDTLI